jgi:hypothetical protein
VHFEKGSILEYNGIYLAELPSPAKAYQDAYDKVRMRTSAARWAADGASTRVVSEGLEPQAYAPTGGAAAPPLPPAGAGRDETPPPQPQPRPQARQTPSVHRDPARVAAGPRIDPGSGVDEDPTPPLEEIPDMPDPEAN